MLNRKRLFIIAILGLSYFLWLGRAVPQPDGVLIPESPEQQLVSPELSKPIIVGDSVAEPLARYKIRARILSKARYWFDRGASIAPVDLALGWGPMSDSRILKELSISQSLRYYHVSWGNPAPLPENEIMHHSANVHVIPADPLVKKILLDLKEGQLIEMSGDLVRINGRDGGEWVSSLSRDDTGAGACELMRVTSIRIL